MNLSVHQTCYTTLFQSNSSRAIPKLASYEFARYYTLSIVGCPTGISC